MCALCCGFISYKMHHISTCMYTGSHHLKNWEYIRSFVMIAIYSKISFQVDSNHKWDDTIDVFLLTPQHLIPYVHIVTLIFECRCEVAWKALIIMCAVCAWVYNMGVCMRAGLCMGNVHYICACLRSVLWIWCCKILHYIPRDRNVCQFDVFSIFLWLTLTWCFSLAFDNSELLLRNSQQMHWRVYYWNSCALMVDKIHDHVARVQREM